MDMTCWANCDSPTFTVFLASRMKRSLTILPRPFNRGWIISAVSVDWTVGAKRLVVRLVDERVLFRLTSNCVPGKNPSVNEVFAVKLWAKTEGAGVRTGVPL